MIGSTDVDRMAPGLPFRDQIDPRIEPDSICPHLQVKTVTLSHVFDQQLWLIGCDGIVIKPEYPGDFVERRRGPEQTSQP